MRSEAALPALLAIVAGAMTPRIAAAGTPLNYLVSAGARANDILPLTWGLLVISIIVVIVMTGLLLWAIFRRRAGPATRTFDNTPASRDGQHGLRWITWGVGVSSLVLFATVIWTIDTLAKVMEPGEAPALSMEVIAHQWWWEVRYDGDTASESFTTANEIHVPVGQPVRVRLKGTDVIHSFWVPALTGKTDVIPGRINETWMSADHPGTFRGQCTEYCGVQHAKMGFLVVAQPAAEFDTWRRNQIAPAHEPETPMAEKGEQQFQVRCSSCHAVRGSGAGGRLGPDLTHLMSRQTLAGATISNTPDELAEWITQAQTIKPQNLMPNIDLSTPEQTAIVAYLETLE